MIPTLSTVKSLRNIKTGPFGTQLKASGYATNSTSETYAVISVGEIRHGYLNITDKTPHVDNNVAQRLPQYILDSRDVVVSRKGNVDRSSQIKEDAIPCFLGSDGIALRFETPELARAYSYILLDPSSRSWLRKHATGSTMLSMNGEILSRLPLPPRSESELLTIAEVLGTLDDKITVNSEIVSSGLKLIDAIYLGTSKYRSESTFEDITTVKGGATPSTKNDEFWDGPYNWATPSDITALDGPWLSSSERKITDAGLQKITSDLYPTGSILMTSRASIGHYALAAEPTAVNQGFIVLNAHNSTLQPWLFAQLRHRTREFIAWANGATFLELPKGVFKKLPVDLPEACADDFAAKVNPLLDRIRTAQLESRALAATRDELLPLLMRGKITVADAEKITTE